MYILLLAFLGLNSCNISHEPEWVDNVNEISLLYCQANELKNDRFTLADSIRFIQDSIMHHNKVSIERVPDWKDKLNKMEERKTMLVNESRNLGDSIRQVLFQLTHEMNVEEKRTFNDSLQAKTRRLNCN